MSARVLLAICTMPAETSMDTKSFGCRLWESRLSICGGLGSHDGANLVGEARGVDQSLKEEGDGPPEHPARPSKPEQRLP